MKRWINRLWSGSDASPSASDANDSPTATATADDGLTPGERVDAAYYRWLTASAAFSAAPEVEQQILDEIQKLTKAPGEAAELVPRMPEIIPRLLRSLRDENMSVTELSREVSQDVVLVAEVIREANSAYYRPIDPVNNVEAAILMLGQNGLRMLLARLAFRPIIQMQPHGFARRAAQRVWKQSEKCALASSLVASGLSAGVFESYLAGLMQNVGLMVSFRLADTICEGGKIPRSSEFGAKLVASSRQLSAGIAAHWDFPEAVVEAIAQASDPGDSRLAKALSIGDRIAKLRVLIDEYALVPDDPLVMEALDPFQRRCMGKLTDDN